MWIARQAWWAASLLVDAAALAVVLVAGALFFGLAMLGKAIADGALRAVERVLR